MTMTTCFSYYFPPSPMNHKFMMPENKNHTNLNLVNDFNNVVINNQIEEGEIDLFIADEFSEIKKRVDLIKKELHECCANVVSGSIEFFCSCLIELADRLTKLIPEISLFDKETLVDLLFTAIKKLYGSVSVECKFSGEGDRIRRDALIKLLIHVRGLAPLLFLPCELTQIQFMISALSSTMLSAKMNISSRSYGTDALEAVSIYQKKFVQRCMHANNLPSPTRSQEVVDTGGCHVSVENSSSMFGYLNFRSVADPRLHLVSNNLLKRRAPVELVSDGSEFKRQRNDSITECGKLYLKPGDPRRALHLKPGDPRRELYEITAKSGSRVIPGQVNTSSSTTKSSIYGTLGCTKPQDNIGATANELLLSTNELGNSAGNLRSVNLKEETSLVCEQVSAGPIQPRNAKALSDVEQFLDGFNEQQKADIRKERVRRVEEQKKLFGDRKLSLVLDLDHTILHSVMFEEVDPMHYELINKKEEQDRGKPERHLFKLPHLAMWTKLRPGIWKFLEKASKLFELHISTMGNKRYATEMARLLDPKGELFSGRVISHGDDSEQPLDGNKVLKTKDMEGILGLESSAIIIDDTVRVWPHHKLNLINVHRYIYFPNSKRAFGRSGLSLVELGRDESQEDGTLASVFAFIEKIHKNFFAHDPLDEADVRVNLAFAQQNILAGCRILFSRIIPIAEASPNSHPLWQAAERLGAVCTNQIDDQVTHVIASSLGTDKVNWALSNGRFVVNPHWLEASSFLFRRANEQDFVIKQK